MADGKSIAFWFDFASTYSYLSAMRIDEMARDVGVSVDWQPFLLGPIFTSQGWSTSPFQVYPAKGRYMVRDMERLARARGLTFVMPETFPGYSLHAARIGRVARREGWIAPFSRAVFEAQFAGRRDIGDLAVLTELAIASGGTQQAVDAARSDAVKRDLREVTEHAQTICLFGAPSFVCQDGEMFWGDDRLEQALMWAVQIGST